MNLKNKEHLLTYFGGEFGWELMVWNPHIRFLSYQYDFTVITRSDRVFLYEDFAKKIITYDWFIDSDGYKFNVDDPNKFNDLIKEEQLKIYQPHPVGFHPTSNGFTINEVLFNQRTFKEFTSNTSISKHDLIIHPRMRSIGEQRNWEYDKWKELTDRLKENYSIGIIGKDDESMIIDDLPYYSSYDYPITINLLNNAKMVIGQSSGAMHLAALCKAPHFVWSSEYNRERYEKLWNPFNTPVHFIPAGWNPSVDKIYNELIKVL